MTHLCIFAGCCVVKENAISKHTGHTAE